MQCTRSLTPFPGMVLLCPGLRNVKAPTTPSFLASWATDVGSLTCRVMTPEISVLKCSHRTRTTQSLMFKVSFNKLSQNPNFACLVFQAMRTRASSLGQPRLAHPPDPALTAKLAKLAKP